MIDYLIKIILFLLPAAIANMAPIVFKKVNFLNYPIDFNKKFLGKPLLGNHKTFRGFFFGIICAIIVVYLQAYFYEFIKDYSIVRYSEINILFFGFLMGFGALLGDSIKSFFKRRIKINPGKVWMPFDQIDWIIGAYAFSLIYVKMDWIFFISLLVFGFFGHLITNYVGYKIGLKKNKF